MQDKVGLLLTKLHAIPTWTYAKHAIFDELVKTAYESKYIRFTGDCRTYQLFRKGQSGLFDVRTGQRGALFAYQGKRVRVVCLGSIGPGSDRIFMVGEPK